MCTTSAKAPIGAAAGTLEIASFQQFAMLLCSLPSGETTSARCLTGTSLWTTSPPVFCQPGCTAWTFRWAAAALEHSFCCQTSHGAGVHASADHGCKRRYNQARTSVHRYPCWRGRGADVSCHGLHVSQGAVGALIFYSATSSPLTILFRCKCWPGETPPSLLRRWFLAEMMAAERANLFCVFLRVPRPAVVALSKAMIRMGQEDDGEEEEVTSPQSAKPLAAGVCSRKHLCLTCTDSCGGLEANKNELVYNRSHAPSPGSGTCSKAVYMFTSADAHWKLGGSKQQCSSCFAGGRSKIHQRG